MKFTSKYTKRLSIDISPETFNWLKLNALNEGRKTGNYARHLLDQLVKRQANEMNGRDSVMEAK